MLGATSVLTHRVGISFDLLWRWTMQFVRQWQECYSWLSDIAYSIKLP